jgi:hypothetical protein
VTPLLLAELNDRGVNIPIPSWLAPLGSVAMVIGITIGWVVLVGSCQALRGSRPWIAHRWAFVLAAVFGGGAVAAFITLIGGGPVRRMFQ